ncbi:MAG: SIMPL domain-containing protein [Planctomycetes bacterium]|nr:SIMPL domain-containing protein [Planctomycetota bacterium]
MIVPIHGGISMNQYVSSISGSRLAMFLLGATLALGFTYSAHLMSSAIVSFKHQNTIKVKGMADKVIMSDSANWTATWTVRSTTLKEGYAELEKQRGIVKKFLSDAKIPDDECTYSALTTQTVFKQDERGHTTNDVFGYMLSQWVVVKSKDVRLIGTVSKSITELIQEGIEIQSHLPQFIFSGLEALKLELLGSATKNAYERATALAENSRGKVGALNSASQGVFQITPVDSTDVSDGGEYDTSTIEKKVKAVVTLEFHIEK